MPMLRRAGEKGLGLREGLGFRGEGGRVGMWYTSAPDEARARLDIKSRQSKWKDRERCVYTCAGVCAEFACVECGGEVML